MVGVFAIFSPNPDALSLADLNAVKKLSHWVSEAVKYTVREPSPLTVSPAIVDPELQTFSAPASLSFLRACTQEAGLRKLVGQNLASYWLGHCPGGNNGRTGQG